MSEPRSGPPGFGYQRRNGKLVADHTEAPIRHRIFELFALHQRKKLVASILNAEGVRTRSGSEWTGTTIGRLIEDATVKGIDGVAEPLVAADLWQRCTDILHGQKESGGASRPVVHLFSGYVHCACGGKMYVPSRTDKYVCGECRGKIPCPDLEAVFQSQLKGTDPRLPIRWPSFTFESKREIVEILTERILIDAKKVTCVLFALSGN